MLSERQLRNQQKRRSAVLLSAILVAGLAAATGFALAAGFREELLGFLGSNLQGWFPFFALLILATVLLLPLLVAEKYARRYANLCPVCLTDFTRNTEQVLATKCCASCHKRIVAGGRPYKLASYQRQRRIRSRTALKYVLWIWPTLALGAYLFSWFDPRQVQNHPEHLLIPALLAVGTTGWSWFRTLDRRYFPPFAASIVLFVLSGLAFWQAFWNV